MVALWTLSVLSAVGFAALGWWTSLASDLASPDGQFLPWGLVFVSCGAAVGGTAIPFVVVGPGRRAFRYIADMPGATLVASVVGLVVGLIIASLVSIPFYAMTGLPGLAVPVALSLVFGCGGLWLGVQRERHPSYRTRPERGKPRGRTPVGKSYVHSRN